MGLATTIKSMSYDHPAYTSIAQRDLGQINGSGGASTKFVAFTAKILKSVLLRTVTAGSATADVISLIGISGTTTTTYGVGTLSDAAVNGTNSFNLANANSGVYPIMNQGDEYYVVNGTDTNGTWVGALEEVIQPLATVAE